MAALDGKITIGIDYRPCIVHIPAVTRNRRQDLNVYPQHPKAHFKATDSSDSAGIVGMSVNEMERFKNEEYC